MFSISCVYIHVPYDQFYYFEIIMRSRCIYSVCVGWGVGGVICVFVFDS